MSYQQTACPPAVSGTEVENPREASGAAGASDGGDYWSVERQLGRMGATDADRQREQSRSSTGSESAGVTRPSSLKIRNAIVGRELIEGMNAEEARDALGPPDSTARDRSGDETWYYRGYDSDGGYRRKTVRFRDGLVSGWRDYDAPKERKFEVNDGRWLRD